MLRVLVNGADGRMGSQVVKAVFEDPELKSLAVSASLMSVKMSAISPVSAT